MLFKPFAHATVGQHMQASIKLSWQLTGLPYVRTCCLGEVASSQDWSELKAGAESFSVYENSSLFALLSSLFSSAPSSSQWIIEVQGDGDRGIYFSTTSGEKDAWMDGQPCPECKSLMARWNVAGNDCLIFSVTAPLCLLERLLRQYRLKTNKTGAVWVTLVRQNQCRCSSISTLFRVQLLGLTIWRLE